MLKSFNRLSVFWKVLLLFIFLVFPMYLFSVYITIKGENSVRSEILKSAESKGNFYMSSLETQLYNVVRLQLNILNDKSIRMLQRLDIEISPAEEYEMLNGIRNMLIETANMNMYIKEITVFLPLVGRKVTTQSVLPIDLEEYHTHLEKSTVENLPFCMINSDYYINMTPEFYGSSVQMPDEPQTFVVSTCISKEMVQASMEDIAGIDEGHVFLVSDGRGLDLSADNTQPLKVDTNKLLHNLSSQKRTTQRMEFDGVGYQVFLNPSLFLHSVLVICIPESSFLSKLKIFSSWIWVMSVLMLLLVGVFSFWLKGMIIQPLKRLIEALKHVEDGTADIQVGYNKNDEFGHIYRQFNYLVNRLKGLVSDVYKKELLLKEAEFKQLQYQINPHFLYNSLLVANGLIQLGDIDCALRLTRHLSNYYQHVTKELPSDIELVKEVDHARNYCEVQNIRFQGRITSQFEELPEEIKEFKVPKLILQPIVENAYKHGLKNKLKDGILKVSFVISGDYFKIVVEDNGDELTDESLKALQDEINHENSSGGLAGTGIKNVHNRLRMRFNGQSGAVIERSGMGGLKVSLVIHMEG